jgi:hypothetical protein
LTDDVVLISCVTVTSLVPFIRREPLDMLRISEPVFIDDTWRVLTVKLENVVVVMARLVEIRDAVLT